MSKASCIAVSILCMTIFTACERQPSFSGVIEMRNNSERSLQAVSVKGFSRFTPVGNLVPGGIAIQDVNKMLLPDSVTISWDSEFAKGNVVQISLESLSEYGKRDGLVFEFTAEHKWTVGFENS